MLTIHVMHANVGEQTESCHWVNAQVSAVEGQRRAIPLIRLSESGVAYVDELQLVLLQLLCWPAAFGTASDAHVLLSLAGAAWLGAAANTDPLVFCSTAAWP